MAISATFYQFRKDRNSTRRPSGSGDMFMIRIKDSCGVLSPALIMDYGHNGNPTAYNYCYIPDFGRYYWITDWTTDRGLWVASCSVDALASWRDYIGSSRQYITRSAYTYDGTVSDSFYPMTATTSTVTTTGKNPFAQKLVGGAYVVGIINNDIAGVGSVSYYVFNQAGFNVFKHVLFSDMDWAGFIFDDVTNLNETLLKAQFNPFQYVVSCVWLPFFYPGITASAIKELPYGWWSLQIGSGLCGHLTNTPTHDITITVPIPTHPQAAARGQYLNYEPYAHYSLQLPYLGCRNIPARFIAGAPSITVSYTVDCVTGQANVNIGGFLRDSVQLGTPIQLAQMSVDYLSGVETAANTAAGLAGNILSGNVAGMIQSAVSGITSIVDASIPDMATKGSNGSIASAYVTPRLVSIFASIADEDNKRQGRPLCQIRQISATPGYLQCARAHIEAPATSQELRTIEDALNSGIYWE